MLKKKLSIAFIVIMFIFSAFVLKGDDRNFRVLKVNTPVEFELSNGEFLIKDYETFDTKFSTRNKELAQKLNISETEAFIMGNLAKYWAENLMKGRSVYLKDNDLIYFRYSYLTKFQYSGFCLINSKPYSNDAFDYRIKGIRRAKYAVLDLDTQNIYDINDNKIKELDNFLVIRKSHLFQKKKANSIKQPAQIKQAPVILEKGDIKIYFSDLTTKLKPDRSCNSNMCKEILNNINNSNQTIDMAIYGYSKVPAIEEALKKAISRGVEIRLICDLDSKGENIYPDTKYLINLIKNNITDKNSAEANNIMHNKFYIFDKKVLITGSANLSHTDMSGFNSNSIVVVNSPAIAKIYTQEFEQMFGGKFHTQKVSIENPEIKINNTSLKVYFSPQDKATRNAIIPIINNAKKYIYIPTFVLTDKMVVEALTNAHKRGVEIKIIIDALNASGKHSKHQILRDAGIKVKTENYAGKMHSKSMIVDDQYTIIGSMNFSYSGENKNDENLIVIKDSEISKFYKEFFLYQWNKIDNKWLKFNARAEGTDSIGSCSDGLDNNYDGLTDIDDPACKNKH